MTKVLCKKVTLPGTKMKKILKWWISQFVSCQYGVRCPILLFLFFAKLQCKNKFEIVLHFHFYTYMRDYRQNLIYYLSNL